MAHLFKFYLSSKREAELIYGVVSSSIGSDIRERSRQYEIPVRWGKEFSCKTWEECADFEKILKVSYRHFAKEMQKALEYCHYFWLENENDYRRKFEKIFEHKLPRFKVALCFQCEGTNSWGTTHDLTINAFDCQQQAPWMALFWETFLDMTFYLIRQQQDRESLHDFQVWGISELAAVAVIRTDFPEQWSPQMTFGYKELAPRLTRAIDYYQNRANFQEFLKNMIEWFKNEPIKGVMEE